MLVSTHGGFIMSFHRDAVMILQERLQPPAFMPCRRTRLAAVPVDMDTALSTNTVVG